ncbi:hypothetical protein HQ560_12575, partial [bacterium]|nr:hypothetical protein [bacterium]
FLAYAFAALCVAAGVAVLRFGAGSAGPEAAVSTQDVPIVGWMLIVLGVLGGALCVVIQRTRQ